MSISITPQQQTPIAPQDSSGNPGSGQTTGVGPAAGGQAAADTASAPTDQIAAHAGLVAQASQAVQTPATAGELDGDGARLLALQVRQQLSSHTLSIANQAPQALLSLLR